MANTSSGLSPKLDAAESAGTGYPLDAPGRVSTPQGRARRQFVKGAFGTLAAAAFGWLTWTKYLFPPGVKSGGVKLGPTKSFAPGGAPQIVTPKSGGASYVVENNGGEFRVLSAVCTHQGCPVGWSPKDNCLECPCHGARFDAGGKVLQGPAKLPLPVLPSRVADGVLFVEG